MSRRGNAHILKQIYSINYDIIHPPFEGANYRWLHKEIYYTYQPPYKSMDLMLVLLESVSRKSLNQCAINRKWYKVIDQPFLEEVPTKIGTATDGSDITISKQRNLTEDEIAVVLEHGWDNIFII